MKPKQIFYIVVCIISFLGIWAINFNIRVSAYLDWDFLLSVAYVIVGLVVIFLVGIIFMLGVDTYKFKLRKKIFKDDNDSKNKKAA